MSSLRSSGITSFVYDLDVDLFSHEYSRVQGSVYWQMHVRVTRDCIGGALSNKITITSLKSKGYIGIRFRTRARARERVRVCACVCVCVVVVVVNRQHEVTWSELKPHCIQIIKLRKA